MNTIWHDIVPACFMLLAGLALPGQLWAAPPDPAQATQAVLPSQKLGSISGTIRLWNIPGSGCTVIQGSDVYFALDGQPVAPANIERWVVSTGNRFSTGHGYRIKDVSRGSHILTIGSKTGCDGYRWRPERRTVSLGVPTYQAEYQDFRYSRK